MFGQQIADVYDLVYRSRGQDFDAEATLVTDMIRARCPNARALLDVGCGTGEHLKSLNQTFGHVEGLDCSAPMLAVARQKLPAVPLHLADMRRFNLGRTFDAIISLSTAVAYLPSTADLAAALKSMVRHLSPGGVLVVEPWYFPESYLDGYITGDIVRGDGHTISRVSRSSQQDRATHIESHWVVADDSSIRHFTEHHVLGLWTREQYLAAFQGAGYTAQYIGDVQSGRGLFVAVARPVGSTAVPPTDPTRCA